MKNKPHFVFVQYVAFEKVTKRLTTEIMASRKAVENQKKKAVEVQEKLVEAQAKHKQSELELEEFRNTVNSANAQKASLTSLSKVSTIATFLYSFIH